MLVSIIASVASVLMGICTSYLRHILVLEYEQYIMYPCMYPSILYYVRAYAYYVLEYVLSISYTGWYLACISILASTLVGIPNLVVCIL